MDGKTLLRELRQVLAEQASSSWMDEKTSYEYLYKAAVEFVSRTKIFTSTQTITTVADQAGYKLNPDFLELAWYDTDNVPFIKYYDGSGTYFLKIREYGAVVFSNQTTSVPVPDTFSIVDYTAEDTVTGESDANATKSGGESLLTDSSASFSGTVYAGDTIHNVDDASCGYVSYVKSNTELYTSLWDGTNNDWTTGDDYKIIPQGKMKLVFDPPPKTAGHTVTVYYVQRPAPVFSDYRAYRIPMDYRQALVLYAAWLYKARDREMRFADYEYKYFDEQVRKANYQYGKALRRSNFRVNFLKSGQKSGSWR